MSASPDEVGAPSGERTHLLDRLQPDEERDLPPVVCDAESAPEGPPWHYDLSDEERAAREEKRETRQEKRDRLKQKALDKTPDKLRQVTKADALRHPNWKMGEKITIDCATLMNKGLEVIEAMRLYGLPLSQVDVVIHRQSIVHSLVEFRDGAVLAQLGVPDMRVPIRLALTYPNRAENPAEPLDLLRCGPLTFDAPDEEAFPCFRLAKQAAQTGGTACAVLNGANETAVAHYLRGECGFYDIPRMVDHALQTVPFAVADTLETVLQADRAARAAADSWMR